eukprot:190479_1
MLQLDFHTKTDKFPISTLIYFFVACVTSLPKCLPTMTFQIGPCVSLNVFLIALAIFFSDVESLNAVSTVSHENSLISSVISAFKILALVSLPFFSLLMMIDYVLF